MNKSINTSNAPAALGPYSQAIQAGNFLYVSGQLGLVPATGEFAGDVTAQTKQAILNLSAILEEAGFSLKDVVKTTVFLKSMDDFGAMNEVYGQYFTEPFPARAAFQVAKLPKDGMVEIEVVAHKE